MDHIQYGEVLWYLNYAISKLKRNGRGQLTLFYTTHHVNTKICYNKKRVFIFMIFFLLRWLRVDFGLTNWYSVNYSTWGNSPKSPSKCFQKCFKSFFLFFASVLLIFSGKVARRQDLQIWVLHIIQNNIGHPKRLFIY